MWVGVKNIHHNTAAADGEELCYEPIWNNSAVIAVKGDTKDNDSRSKMECMLSHTSDWLQLTS